MFFEKLVIMCFAFHWINLEMNFVRLFFDSNITVFVLRLVIDLGLSFIATFIPPNISYEIMLANQRKVFYKLFYLNLAFQVTEDKILIGKAFLFANFLWLILSYVLKLFFSTETIILIEKVDGAKNKEISETINSLLIGYVSISVTCFLYVNQS